MENNYDTFEVHLTDSCPLRCKHCYAFKTHTNMTEDVLNKTIDFIIDMANDSISDNISILFTGGEIGIYDMSLLLPCIHKLRTNITSKDLEITCQTSLMYEITDLHKELFKLLDCVGVSWDYEYRFNSINDESKFFKNLELLKTLNPNIGMIICLTDELVKNVTPRMLLSFMMASGIKRFDLNRMFVPLTTKNGNYIKNVSVKNTEVKEYMYNVFRLHEELSKTHDIDIFDFEVIKSAYKGIHYNACSNDCWSHQMNISPIGKISTCMKDDNNSYGDVMTSEINYSKLLDEHLTSNNLHTECYNCKYFEYCLGGCPHMYFDDTGCSVPTKIFDYLKTKEELHKNS